MRMREVKGRRALNGMYPEVRAGHSQQTTGLDRPREDIPRNRKVVFPNVTCGLSAKLKHMPGSALHQVTGAANCCLET